MLRLVMTIEKNNTKILIAVQKLNDPVEFPIYGIVTDGKIWEFSQEDK